MKVDNSSKLIHYKRGRILEILFTSAFPNNSSLSISCFPEPVSLGKKASNLTSDVHPPKNHEKEQWKSDQFITIVTMQKYVQTLETQLKVPRLLNTLIIGCHDYNGLLQVNMLHKIVHHVISGDDGFKRNRVIEKAGLVSLSRSLEVHRDDTINACKIVDTRSSKVQFVIQILF